MGLDAVDVRSHTAGLGIDGPASHSELRHRGPVGFHPSAQSRAVPKQLVERHPLSVNAGVDEIIGAGGVAPGSP